MSSLYVDFISPKGHSTINSFYCDNMRSDDFFVCKKDYLLGEGTKAKRLSFDTFSQSETQSYYHALEQFIFTAICFFKNYKTFIKAERIIFLSYSPIWNGPLISLLYVLFNKNIYVLEHNSVPLDSFSIRTLIKRKIFSLVSKCVTHLVYEDYIGFYLKKSFNSSFIKVSHPVLCSSSNSNSNEVLIFSPSASTPSYINDWLKAYCSKNNISCLIKSKLQVKIGSVECRTRFDNYDDIINKSSAVIIGADFSNRVSGVFYEALSSPKFIFLFSSKFAESVKDKYPNVYVFSNRTELENLLLDHVTGNIGTPDCYDVERHNREARFDKVIK